MPEEQPIDRRWPVPDVIDSLLRTTPLADLHALVPRLVRECAVREFVAAPCRSTGGELSEGKGNLIAREGGLVARDALSGVPRRVE
jgi:hypothetical protein